HLPALAAKMPYKLAVAEPAGRNQWGRVAYTHYTYRRLNEICDRFAYQLESCGVRRGVRTVLMVPPGLHFFALTFPLLKIAAVPVLVDPGMGLRNVGKCLAEAEPAAFIGVNKAHYARILFGWAKRTVKSTINVGTPFFGSRHRLEAVETNPMPPDDAP